MGEIGGGEKMWGGSEGEGLWVRYLISQTVTNTNNPEDIRNLPQVLNYMAGEKISIHCCRLVHQNHTKVLNLAQLFSTNKLCLNVLSTSTAIYCLSIENRKNFFIVYYQRIEISQKWH